jgi:hypothetical protein
LICCSQSDCGSLQAYRIFDSSMKNIEGFYNDAQDFHSK